MVVKVDRTRILIGGMTLLFTVAGFLLFIHFIIKPPYIAEIIIYIACISFTCMAFIGAVTRGNKAHSAKQRVTAFIVGPLALGFMTLLGGLSNMFFIGVTTGGLIFFAATAYYLLGPRQ